MAKAKKKNAAQAQPQEATAAEGEVVKTESAELKIVTNNDFTVVDNTNESAGETEAPEPGKAKPRKEKLNGFTVVDYE